MSRITPPDFPRDLNNTSTSDLVWSAIRAWPRRRDELLEPTSRQVLEIVRAIDTLRYLVETSRRFRSLCEARNMTPERMALRIGALVRLREIEPKWSGTRLVGHAPVGSCITKTYCEDSFDLRELNRRDLVWLAATHLI